MDPEAMQYITGVALHWYYSVFFPPQLLDTVHLSFPNLQILTTEAYWYYYGYIYAQLSNVPTPGPSPSYGTWQNAPDFAKAIIQVCRCGKLSPEQNTNDN